MLRLVLQALHYWSSDYHGSESRLTGNFVTIANFLSPETGNSMNSAENSKSLKMSWMKDSEVLAYCYLTSFEMWTGKPVKQHSHSQLKVIVQMFLAS